MRKPHDYEAELSALTEKAKALKSRKTVQLGELVIATGADALPIDVLAGALIAAVENTDPAITEGWRRAGEAMFSSGSKRTRRAGHSAAGRSANNGGAEPAARAPRT